MQGRIRHPEWSAIVPLLVLIAGAVLYWFVYHYYRSDTPVHSDGEGYYAYLPAYIAHFDPSFKSVITGHLLPTYPRLGPVAAKAAGLSLQPTGMWLDKYGTGTALLMLPFFLVGHLVALAAGAQADGYSTPEVAAVGCAALAFTVAGLLALRALLRRWFDDRAVALSLIAVTLGTGLVSYFSYDPTFSHNFAFFALALALLTAVRWYERPASWWRAVALGCAVGLVVAIRLTNVVLLCAIPLIGVGSLAAARARRDLVRLHLARVAVAVCAALLVMVPQVATWFVATGHLFTRPYPGESFDFAHPHLIESLIWLQPHGLLPYAPVMVLAFIGLAAAWVRRRDIALPVTLAFLPFWYLTSAWYDWSFSSSFGDRAYLDILPLLAIPMAWLLSSLRRHSARVAASAVVAALLICTSMLMIAWWQHRMAGDGIDARGFVDILTQPQRLLGPPVR